MYLLTGSFGNRAAISNLSDRANSPCRTVSVFVTCSVELRTRHFYVATLFVVRELVDLTRGLRRYDDSS